MTNNKYSIVALVVIAIIAISALVTSFNVSKTVVVGPQGPKGEQGPVGPRGLPGEQGQPGKDGVTKTVLGASGSGQNTLTRQYFDAGLTQGGSYSTTSAATLGTYKLTAAELRSSVVQWNNGLNLTLQIGSSTAEIIPRAGDVAKIQFLNASTTAGATITFAAVDSNVDLQYTEATGGDLILNGLDWAELTFIRQTSGKISVIFNEFTEAD